MKTNGPVLCVEDLKLAAHRWLPLAASASEKTISKNGGKAEATMERSERVGEGIGARGSWFGRGGGGARTGRGGVGGRGKGAGSVGGAWSGRWLGAGGGGEKRVGI